MHRVARFQHDGLLALPALILRAPLRRQGRSPVRLGAAIAQRQAQLQVEAVAGKIEAAELIERIQQAAARKHDGCAAAGVNLVSAPAAGVVEGAEVQVWLQPVGSDPKVRFVDDGLLFQRHHLRARLQGRLDYLR